jgi:hypothetical protein
MNTGWITVWSEDEKGKIVHHYYTTSRTRAFDRLVELAQTYDRRMGVSPWVGHGPFITKEVA